VFAGIAASWWHVCLYTGVVFHWAIALFTAQSPVWKGVLSGLWTRLPVSHARPAERQNLPGILPLLMLILCFYCYYYLLLHFRTVIIINVLNNAVINKKKNKKRKLGHKILQYSCSSLEVQFLFHWVSLLFQCFDSILFKLCQLKGEVNMLPTNPFCMPLSGYVWW